MSAQEMYLNQAETSCLKPQTVVDAGQDAMGGSPDQWDEHFEQAHRAIAKFFSMRDPEQLWLTPGCTSALAVALADIDLGGRNRVLTSRWEHHATHRPLLKLAQSGVAREYIPASDESPLELKKLYAKLPKGDVGLVAITASSNVTGDLLPFEKVIALGRAYGHLNH